MSRPSIPLADLAFAHELRCIGLTWKQVSQQISWERTALIKGISKRLEG